MGLDLVELVLRTEEVFAVDLPDDECSLLRTVGDLYRLVLEKLSLPYMPSIDIEGRALGLNRLRAQISGLNSWNPPDVWLTIKALVSDQLGLHDNAVKESARFLDDLGCD